MTNSVIVWDQPGYPVEVIGEAMLWQSYADNHSYYSIPRYLEDHAERLRAKYLAFIHDLGESKVRGKRIVDHLDMGDGFSFWWMTKLAEKSPFKSPNIYDCLRVLALEEILLEKKPSRLELKSSDRNLACVIRRLCKTLNISFCWQKASYERKNWSLRHIHRNLPHSMQGIISFFKHVVLRWPLRAVKKQKWFSTDSSIFVFSYFIHLDGDALKQGKFCSRHWGPLPIFMQGIGFQVNWLHHFLISSVVPNMRTGISSLAQFNQDSDNQGHHAFLDTYLTLGVVIRALKRLMWLNFAAWRARCFSSYFHPSNSSSWLWPLLRDDWLTSTVGSIASANCLWFELFDAAMRDLPHQKTGLYLCENQGWEYAFLHAWRKHRHGKIVGFQHSTTPFWHLYYYDDPRTINSTANCRRPLPDKLAVNGSVAWSVFVSSGYPIDRLVEVEALRYLDLPRISNRIDSNQASRPLAKSCQSQTDNVKVIVLGDISPASNHFMLCLLESAKSSLPGYYKFVFKPHPSCQVDLTKYPGLDMEQTIEALGGILGKFDVAVSANSTSAAIDAFLASLPVIIGLDGSSLNLSPLRGRVGVSFVGSDEEMVAALTNNALFERVGHDLDLFWLDADLPRWRQLLATINTPESV